MDIARGQWRLKAIRVTYSFGLRKFIHGTAAKLINIYCKSRAVYPEGYGYSHYCEIYGAWKARLTPTMRQSHVAGERMFVDYAGTTLAVIDGSCNYSSLFSARRA